MKALPGVCLCLVALLASSAFARDAKPGENATDGASAGKPVATFRGHPSAVTALAFRHGGDRITSVCSDDVRTWNTATGKENGIVKSLGGQVAALGLHGTRVALAAQFARTRNDDVTVHDAANGKELLRIDPHPDRPMRFAFRPVVGAVAFSPDGGRFATAGSIGKPGGRHGYPGGAVTVWDARTGKLLHRFFLSTFASTVAFSRDGKYLAAGTDGAGGELPEPGEVWVWNVEKGKAMATFQTKEEVAPGDNPSSAVAVAFSPDGKRVAAAVSGVRPARPAGLIPQGGEEPASVLIWEVGSRRVERTLRVRGGWVSKVAFSPDGMRLATAGGSDRKVRVWSAAGKEMQTLPFGGTAVDTLVFSPDGEKLAVGGAEGGSGVVEVWAVGRQPARK